METVYSSLQFLTYFVAAPARVELATAWLTAACSAIELWGAVLPGFVLNLHRVWD